MVVRFGEFTLDSESRQLLRDREPLHLSRKAFDALMNDKAFLAEAEKRQLGISPRPGMQVQALVDKIITASPELVARVKTAVGQVN